MRKNLAKNRKRAASLLAGASVLLGGCTVAAPAMEFDVADETAADADAQADAGEGTREDAVAAAVAAVAVSQDGLAKREEKELVKVANVNGLFSFSQDVLTPDDEIFSIYGTAVTGVCAAPSFAVDAEGESSYYINVGGQIEKAYTVDVAKLAKDKSESRILKCSCGMSGQNVSNARVTGIPLNAVLEMAKLDETVNCVTVYGADGYGVPMPLTYALERNALLVYQVNGHDTKELGGGAVQLWMPEAAARYFTRAITHIELTAEEEEPEILAENPAYRAKINILNYADNVEFAVGDTITLEGYADDYDVAVEAVEFSLDGGETWSSCPTEGATADRWVYWQFSFVAEEPGSYEMTVRARTADGKESPLASTLEFTVKSQSHY